MHTCCSGFQAHQRNVEPVGERSRSYSYTGCTTNQWQFLALTLRVFFFFYVCHTPCITYAWYVVAFKVEGLFDRVCTYDHVRRRKSDVRSRRPGLWYTTYTSSSPPEYPRVVKDRNLPLKKKKNSNHKTKKKRVRCATIVRARYVCVSLRNIRTDPVRFRCRFRLACSGGFRRYSARVLGRNYKIPITRQTVEHTSTKIFGSPACVWRISKNNFELINSTKTFGNFHPKIMLWGRGKWGKPKNLRSE